MGIKYTKCHFCEADLVRREFPTRKPLLHFCNNVCKGEYQRTQKPVTRDWLVEHYIVKEMDCTQIAAIVKRDPKSVWNWLIDLGIPTRPRGSNQKVLFKKGERSGFSGRIHSDETKKRLSELAKADGRVPYDPKVGSYMKGKKGSETTNWKGGITAERQAFYGSREWKLVAVQVWARDNASCQRCGKKKEKSDKLSFDIHHIVSFACVELRADLSNLILLCETCHYWVHSRENTNREFIVNECDRSS